MYENEIEEFCETSSWETSSEQEDYIEEKEMNIKNIPSEGS